MRRRDFSIAKWEQEVTGIGRMPTWQIGSGQPRGNTDPKALELLDESQQERFVNAPVHKGRSRFRTISISVRSSMRSTVGGRSSLPANERGECGTLRNECLFAIASNCPGRSGR